MQHVLKNTCMLALITCHETMTATVHEINAWHATSHEPDVMNQAHVMKPHDHENISHETT